MQRWIETFLGIEQAAAGEGTDWSLAAPGMWAPSLLVLFLVAATGLIGWVYWREGPGRRRWKMGLIILRLLLVLLLLGMLFETQVAIEQTGLPHVAVLVDVSASMSEIDAAEQSELQELVRRTLADAELETAHRLNQAKALLVAQEGRLLKRLGRDYQIDLYFVAGGIERVLPVPSTETAEESQPGPDAVEGLLAEIRGAEPDGQQSALGDAVRQVLNDLQGTDPTALVLLTDGVTTQGETLSQAAQYAKRRGVPLYLIGLGSQTPKKDIALGELLVDEVVFVDDVVAFEVPITASGYSGQSVQLRLRADGSPTVLAEESVSLGPDGVPVRRTISYRPPEVGTFEYIVEVTPQDGEINPDNNTARRRVQVRDDKLKVLLVEGQPRFEYRYLKVLLERDSTVELDTILQSADPGWAETDRSALRPNVFPVSADQLAEYHVVIFGDVNPQFLSESTLKNLSAFVREQGGGLAFIAGSEYLPAAYANTPLADLLPVQLDGLRTPGAEEAITQGFRPRLTPFGDTSPQMQLGSGLAETKEIWANLPELFWSLEVNELKPGARALAVHPRQALESGEPMPVLLQQYVGSGLVLFHTTDETYRWRYQVGDVYFARYWIQAIRQLGRAKLLGLNEQVQLAVDRQVYRRGDPVRLEVRFPGSGSAPPAGQPVTVSLESETAKLRVPLSPEPDAPTVFTGIVSPTQDGRYRAALVSPIVEGERPTADFQVLAPPGEREQVTLNRAELEYAAALTDGKFYRFDTASELPDDLPRGRRIPVESRPPVLLWNQWWVLLMFLTLLIGEWLLRKRLGLV